MSDSGEVLADEEWVPVTFDDCSQVMGPFFHGTRYDVAIGDELVAGHESNFQAGRIANNVCFSALVETAVWGAELSTALAGVAGHPPEVLATMLDNLARLRSQGLDVIED